MTTDKALVAIAPPTSDGQLAPYERAGDVIARATEWANALMDVVEKKRLYAMINGKKHLEAEAWELIMAFDHAGPQIEWVRPMENSEGIVLGYLAQVNIVKEGKIKASAIMPCGFDDFPCRGKDGTARVKAAMSAAQTWAMAKACRLCYSPVAVLAGYAPTPAEEMQHGSAPPIRTPAATRPRPGTEPSHCTLHDNIRLGLTPDKRRGHRLKDGTFCYGVVPEAPVEPEAQEAPAMPDFPDTPLGTLQREVNQEDMAWTIFEDHVLKMTWAEWVRLGGTVDTARKRWATWKKQQEAQQ